MATANARFFDAAFHALTGNPPFPWQQELFRRLVAGERLNACDIPTGLGKTAIIAIWLIALAYSVKSKGASARIPRRLVYVVNRRTVVDQSTSDAERIRKRLNGSGDLSNEDRDILKELRHLLARLCTADHDEVLAISTLRGLFADNREWSADPAQPAVIVGTVDMIGSRLLFNGYCIGFKSKPLHAAFLGQDSLLVHDEAHLEPAFQRLMEEIEREQDEGERTGELPWPKLRVMALSATARGNDHRADNVLTLDKEDRKHPTVQRRIKAKKTLRLYSCADEKKDLVGDILERALEHKDSGDAVLVFVRAVEDVLSVLGQLERFCPGNVVPLTGTMRGRERDQLVQSDPVFARFMPVSDRPKGMTPAEGTVYLVCTSAGEVGVNLSADHMVSDLSTFDSMAQRLGRVNRFGDRKDTRVDVVYPESFEDKKPGPQRKATLDLLRRLPSVGDGLFDASPKALSGLKDRSDLPCKLADAFSPPPAMLDATDILFDAWALTTIRDKLPGRPPVAPFLHGIAEWEPPETHVAWREEVSLIVDDLRDHYPPGELLDDYPLKPHELLRDRSDRVFDKLQTLASREPTAPVWLVDEQGEVVPWTLGSLARPSATQAASKKPLIARIERATILLPPNVGGLSRGMLDGASPLANDVSDIDAPITERRVRLWFNDEEYKDRTRGMRLVQSIDLNRDRDDDDRPTWDWYKQKPLEDARTAEREVLWDVHVGDVVRHIDRILTRLALPKEIAQAVRVAVKLHDSGKRRPQFQFGLGNRAYPRVMLAKSGRAGARLPETYRHEFGSIADAVDDVEFQQLSSEMQDLVLHLIAAHHGRARPHFRMAEVFDSAPGRTRSDADLASDVPRRFARLQRKYGRWGLAYLESLLRAADWAASADPSEFVTENEEVLR